MLNVLGKAKGAFDFVAARITPSGRAELAQQAADAEAHKRFVAQSQEFDTRRDAHFKNIGLDVGGRRWER